VKRALAIACVAAAAALWCAPARAYVRTRTTSGTPIAWTHGCLKLHFDSSTPNPMFAADRTKRDLDGALATWNGTDQACTELSLERGNDEADPNVAFDGKSMVLWRLPGFCDRAENAEDEACLSPDATATTTVFFHDDPGARDDGEIVEADMELNAVHFAFDDQGSTTAIDLPSVFAHELGHSIGLDHTCTVNQGATAPVDDMERPVPFCFPVAALPASVTSATMYNFIAAGQTNKRGPGPDEKRAACSIYSDYSPECSGSSTPPATGQMSCSLASVGRLSAGAAVTASILAAALALERRRRRRR
jgi:hypothetical protein